MVSQNRLKAPEILKRHVPNRQRDFHLNPSVTCSKAIQNGKGHIEAHLDASIPQYMAYNPKRASKMAKTFTIQIRSFDDALEGLARTFKALQAGKRVTRRRGVYFTSLEAARNLLTPRRLAL